MRLPTHENGKYAEKGGIENRAVLGGSGGRQTLCHDAVDAVTEVFFFFFLLC